MKNRTPIKVSKETHLKIIVLLLLVTVTLLFMSRCAALRPAAPVPSPASSERSSGEVSGTVSAGTAAGFSMAGLELPYCADETFLIRNEVGRYTLRYDTAYRQAAWVAYLLTRRDVRTKGTGRKNSFRSDPEVVARRWPSATTKHYAGSGYDRGHLLPSADRNNTPEENRPTFNLSNISPQCPALNRGVWKSLEAQVRRWAERYDSLYIVTGTELKPGLRRIAGGVGVPENYFKAVLVKHDGTFQSIAFLVPNVSEFSGGFGDYVLTVRELEQRLDYNFYYRLPDSIAREAESRVDKKFWQIP